MAKLKGKWIEDSTIAEVKLDINNSPSADYLLKWNAIAGKMEWGTAPAQDAHDLKITASDTTPGFLDGKLLITTNKLTKTVNNSGGNETITLNIGSDVFDKSVNTTDNITEGATKLFYTDVRADARITLQKGAANGLCPLDSTTKISSSYLPAIAITDTFVVASQVAQLALTAEKGDIAVRTDLNQSFVHNGGTAGTMDDWTLLLTPTDTVLSVNSKTGIVVLGTGDISESGGNEYFTQTRARGSLSSGTSINYNSSTGVIAVDVASLNIETQKVEVLTLSGTNITNKYIDLANVPKTANAVMVHPVGGPAQEYTVDFTVVSDGSVVKRLNWSSLGMDGVLESGDKLIVSYTY
jgi:hypothetical protein